MRLRIGKGNTYLNLRRGTSVQLDLQSPLYFADNRSADVFPSVRTYSIAVPNTAHNRLLLGRPAEMDNPADFLYQDGWFIQFDGFQILEGRLEVEYGDYETDITITFVGGLAGNLEELKSLNLRDLTFDRIPLGETQEEILANLAALAADPESDLVFPMIQTDATGQQEDTTADDVDNPLPTVYQYLNYLRDGEFKQSGFDNVFDSLLDPENPRFFFRATIAPQVKLRPVLDNLLARVQYRLAGVFDSNTLADELNELLLFSNYTLDSQIGQGTEELTFTDVELLPEYDPARSMPNKTGADLIKAVANLFCLAPILDTVGRRLLLVACKDLLDIPAKANWTSKVFPQYRRGKRLEEVPNTFYFDNPDEGYAAENPRIIRMASLDDVFETLEDAEATYTVADAGKYIWIGNLNEFFYTRYLPLGSGFPTPVLYLAPQGKDLGVVGEGGDTPFVPSCTTLHSITTTGIDGTNAGWRITNGAAALYGLGPRLVSAFYAELQTPLQSGEPLDELIFLINRGLIPDRDGNPTPYAGSAAYDYLGQPLGNMSLIWTGDFGIYNIWWREWILALQAMRNVVYPTRLTAKDLASLDWREKVIIDRHSYFVKRIQVTLTTDDILPATVEYMQLA